MENEEQEKLLEERKKYYSNTFVQFELIKCLKHRELCFLSAKSEETKKSVRYILAFSIDYLKKHFDWVNFYKFNVNMYHSVAVLQNVPIFSYNMKERTKKDEYKEFNKNYKDYVIGYNLFMDFDGKENFEKCLEEVKEAKKIFNEYKLPYYILNSSFNGFHIQIPAEYMPKMEINELIDKINKVIYNFKGVYDFTCLDDSVIDIKRVCKMPYSYEGTGAICLPLTDKQLEEFKPEMVSMKNVLKDVRVIKRGLLIRTHNSSAEQLKLNVEKFLKDFSE